MNNVFHAGELAVQRQAGVAQMAARVGRSIKPTILPAAAHFLQERPFAIVASTDSKKRPWASLLTGPPPFMHTLDEQTLRIQALPLASDPLLANLQARGQVGLLAIDFATRRRMRLNGTAVWHDDEFIIHANQVYANCPKYIQKRSLSMRPLASDPPESSTTTALSTEQVDWIATADTLFIATAHPKGGADASHRGGNKGFVHVQNSQQLIIPDYSGNMMFNTLGNIAANPKAGLLFFDFESNRLLQLTGQAKIVWDDAQIAHYAGAERLVVFNTEQVIETKNALPFAWTFHSYSPFNPAKTSLA